MCPFIRGQARLESNLPFRGEAGGKDLGRILRRDAKLSLVLVSLDNKCQGLSWVSNGGAAMEGAEGGGGEPFLRAAAFQGRVPSEQGG